MNFPIDEITTHRGTASEALTRLQVQIAYRIAEVEDEVERWEAGVCRGPMREDGSGDGFVRAAVVLERLRKMPWGWWRRHARDSVEDLLQLRPCLVCPGLCEGDAAVCEGCAGAEEVTCG